MTNTDRQLLPLLLYRQHAHLFTAAVRPPTRGQRARHRERSMAGIDTRRVSRRRAHVQAQGQQLPPAVTLPASGSRSHGLDEEPAAAFQGLDTGRRPGRSHSGLLLSPRKEKSRSRNRFRRGAVRPESDDNGLREPALLLARVFSGPSGANAQYGSRSVSMLRASGLLASVAHLATERVRVARGRFWGSCQIPGPPS
jgi:hypothetical protein